MAMVAQERGLQALEGFFDAPARVVEIAEQGGGEGCGVQVGGQPGGRIAPVEHPHIVGPEHVQRLHPLAPLGRKEAVNAGVKGQLCAQQVQRKQTLIALGG